MVGERLGVAHTTIGRWEKGEVPVTVEVLEKLAEVYGITRSQIEHSPDSADMVAFLDRAQHIIEGMPSEDLERWLQIGESLRARK
jgi:transcriptional regulator with XRE-family HTH domain